MLVLRDIDIAFSRGTLTAIIGKVGAGKTALFDLLLGELERSDDAVVEVNGNIAYAA